MMNSLKFLKFNGNNLNLIKRYQSTHYDIIIVGGGLVGTTLACTLGKNNKLDGKKILLLEAGKKRNLTLPENYTNRVSSLNPSTKNLLNSIDVWKHIESARYSTVKGMKIWEGNSNANINFDGETLNDDIAYIIENDVVLNGVYKEIETLPNVEIINEAKVTDYQLMSQETKNKITLNDKSFTTDLLLGCDGYKSQIREKMNVHYLSWNYDQMGIVATLKLDDESDNQIAWQKFLPTGPIALLPLTKNLVSLVWSTTIPESQKLLKLTDDEFIEELNKSLWSTSRNVIIDQSTKLMEGLLNFINSSKNHRQLPPKIVKCQENSRAAFPLGFGHSTSYVTKGAALVGDAAHRVHPLAGQGVNLGFGDINCLNRILGETVYNGDELGSLIYLKEYETERQRHNVPTMLAVDGLYRLYGTDFLPAVFFRSLGIQAINSSQTLKNLLKNHASA